MQSTRGADSRRQEADPTAAALDLDAYCARINYTGPRETSVEALKGLHSAHVCNVPFENLDIHLGKSLSLRADDLFAKIVGRKRGGYCYEVNSLFAMVLRAIGFQVQCLLARVLFNMTAVYPRSHQLLLVTVDKKPWIADVGFGSCCLREPMRLKPGMVSDQGPDRFRLRKDSESAFVLEAMPVGRWQDLYSFTLEPYLLVDYEPYNYYNSTSPQAKWTQQRVCTLPTPEGRIVAVDWEFKIHSAGSTQTVRAETDEEYRRMLSQYFRLEIADPFIR